MKRTAAAVLLFAVAGCRWELADDKYFNTPAESDEYRIAGHKTVWDDKGNRLGYVEIQRSNVKGSKEEHEDWFVKDRDNNVVGFITEGGHTYKFKRSSQEYTHVGNYTAKDGVRTLLGIRTAFELRSTKLEE